MKIILTLLTTAVCVKAIELGPLLDLLQSSSNTNVEPTVQLVPPYQQITPNQEHVQLFSIPIDGDIILLTHNAIDNEKVENSKAGDNLHFEQTVPNQQQEHSKALPSKTEDSVQNTVEYDIVPSNSFSFTYTDQIRPRSLTDSEIYSEQNDADQSVPQPRQDTVTSTNSDPVDSPHQMKYIVEMTKSDTYSYSLPVQIADSQEQKTTTPNGKETTETEDEPLNRLQETQATEQLQQYVPSEQSTAGNNAHENAGTAQYTLTGESFGAVSNQQVTVPVQYVPVADPQFIQETQYVPVSGFSNTHQIQGIQNHVAAVPIQYVPVPVPVPLTVDDLIVRQNEQTLYGLHDASIPVTTNEAIQYVPVPQYTQEALGVAYDTSPLVQYNHNPSIVTQGIADPGLGLTNQVQYFQYVGLPESQDAQYVTHQNIPLVVNYYIPTNTLQSNVQYAPSLDTQQNENLPQITPPTVDDDTVHVDAAPDVSNPLIQSQADAIINQNVPENVVANVADVSVTAAPPHAPLIPVTSTEESAVDVSEVIKSVQIGHQENVSEIDNAPRQPKSDEQYPGLEHARRVLSIIREA